MRMKQTPMGLAVVETDTSEETRDLRADVARLRRENRRLGGWLRYIRGMVVEQFGPEDGALSDFDDALAGKPAPKVKR